MSGSSAEPTLPHPPPVFQAKTGCCSPARIFSLIYFHALYFFASLHPEKQSNFLEAFDHTVQYLPLACV